MDNTIREVIQFWSDNIGLTINGNETSVGIAVKRHGGEVKGAVIFICHRIVIKRFGSVGGAALTKALGDALGNIIYDVLYEHKKLKSIHLWFREFMNGLDLDVGTKVRCELQSRWFVSQVLDMIKIGMDAQPPAGESWARKVISALENS